MTESPASINAPGVRGYIRALTALRAGRKRRYTADGTIPVMGFQRKLAWISEARFKPYLDECEGDTDKAWELYEWNAHVSSALSECIHHVEVLLRNSMIVELAKLHPLQYPWHAENSMISQIAQKKRRSPGRPASPDDVIANLNLGFWKQLLQDKPADNEDLWRTTLRNAFPHSRGDRKTVLNGVEDLFEIRNRCAHQDSLLGFDPSVELKKIIKLARWIDPAAGQWIDSIERVTEAIAARPIPPKMDTVIIGDANNRNYQVYQRVHALINPTSRKIAPVRHLGFYHTQRIEPDFPEILGIVVPTVWSTTEARRLKKSDEPDDKQLGKIMSYAIDQGFLAEESFEVYLLSSPEDTRTVRTTSGKPIEHRKRGRGTGFVKGGRRYFSISTLINATETAELE